MTMINFVLDKSKNYELVQRDLINIIASHLNSHYLAYSKENKINSALNFTLFVRQPADVLMSHGVADKNYFTDIRDSEGDLFVNRFDAVLVPGQWMKRKLLAHPDIQLNESQIHCVGWPRLDLLRAQSTQPEKKQNRKKVLWAPTHDRAKKGLDQISTSSFPAFLEYLPLLEKFCDVRTSVHPRNRSNKKPTYEELLEADIVISDFGTLVYEAWALGKPVVFPGWINGELIQQFLPGSAEAHIYSQKIGCHASNIDELIDLIHIENSIGESVHEFMEDYLQNYHGGMSGLNVAKVLLQLEEDHASKNITPVISAQRSKKSGFEVFLKELHAETPARTYNWSKNKEQACEWILDRVVPGQGVDIGGTEYLCKQLTNSGRSTIYYDINSPENYAPSIQDDMINILDHFKDRSLDFIVSRHTLEHSVAPMFQLWAYNKILKDGGQLIVVVPVHCKEWVWFHTHHNCLPMENWLMLFYRTGFRIQETGSGTWNPRRPLFVEMRFDLRVESRTMRLGGGPPSY